MRISDWSSDVCSSDLGAVGFRIGLAEGGMQHCEGRLEVAEPFHRRRDEHVAGEEGMPGAFADPAPRQAVRLVGPGVDVLHQDVANLHVVRSAKLRLGQECVHTCRSRVSPYLYKKKTK